MKLVIDRRQILLRTWLNADKMVDTYETRAEYQCVNGSQFVVEGGPNMTVEIR